MMHLAKARPSKSWRKELDEDLQKQFDARRANEILTGATEVLRAEREAEQEAEIINTLKIAENDGEIRAV